MIIEQAKNGFIIREDDESVVVFQSEIDSMNHALGAMLNYLWKHYEDRRDVWKVHIKIDTRTDNVSAIK